MGVIIAELFFKFGAVLFESTRQPDGEKLPLGERIARQIVLWALVLFLLSPVGLLLVIALG